MKILFLTPSSATIRNKEELPHFQPQFFWLKAMRQLRIDVKVFRYTDPAVYFPSKLDRKFADFSPEYFIRNQKMLKIFEQYKPEYVFFSSGTEIVSSKTIEHFSKTSKVVVFNGTEPKTFFNAREIASVPFVFLAVTNADAHTQQWKSLGIQNAITLPISAIDPEYHMTSKDLEKDIEVSFLATFTRERQYHASNLLELIPDLKLWGSIPPKTELDSRLHQAYQGEAWGDTWREILQRSKISLNIMAKHIEHGANLKAFEIPASRALQISTNDQQTWFSQEEIVTVKGYNYTDISGKVKYYLSNKNKRNEIVESAYEKTISSHTYFHRFKKLFTHMKNISAGNR